MIEHRQIVDFLTTTLAGIFDTNSQDLDADLDFDSYGLNSSSAIIMLGELEEFIDMDLSPSVLFEHDTINKLATYIAKLVQPLEKVN